MNDDNECPICFHEILFPQQVDCCKKRFHESCLSKWYSKSLTCPCCRNTKNIGNENNKIAIFNEFFNNYYNRHGDNMLPINERQRMPIPRLTKSNHEIVAIFTKYAHHSKEDFTRQIKDNMFDELRNLIHKKNIMKVQQKAEHEARHPIIPQVVEIALKKR